MARKRGRATVPRTAPSSPERSASTSRRRDNVPGLVTDAASAESLRRILTTDAFRNMPARMGFQTPSLLEATEYPLTRLTNDYQLLIALYRNHWIVRKIVDSVAEDMTRNWVRITSQMAPDALQRLDRGTRRWQLRRDILLGLKWGRLYGGAVGVFKIAGHEQMLDQPLDLDTVLPGTFRGLQVLDRWVGAYPSEELVEELGDPDFGLPEYYEVALTSGQSMRVHHSRLVRFTGRHLPYWEQLAEVYWGESEIEVVYEELRKRDNASYNIATLIFLANLRVIKKADAAQMMAVGDQQAMNDAWNVIHQQNVLMSNSGMMVLGPNDEFATFQNTTFTGLNDVYQSFMMDVAGAAGIPVTRLFGRSPAGMDSTGDADLTHYYEMVQEQQDTHLRPVLDKILPLLCVSELGAIPDDLDYAFQPIRKPSATELADIVEKRSRIVLDAYAQGLIPQKTGLQELRALTEDTGAWGSITDEQVERADDIAEPPGEDMSGGLAGYVREPAASGGVGPARPGSPPAPPRPTDPGGRLDG